MSFLFLISITNTSAVHTFEMERTLALFNVTIEFSWGHLCSEWKTTCWLWEDYIYSSVWKTSIYHSWWWMEAFEGELLLSLLYEMWGSQCGEDVDVFWTETACGLLSIYLRLGWTCCLHLQVSSNMPMFVFRVVTPCGIVDRYQRFGWTYCLNLQGWILMSMFVLLCNTLQTCRYTPTFSQEHGAFIFRAEVKCRYLCYVLWRLVDL